ncbi:pantothenate kinase 2-like [Iris pallida]|uniref:Pantothenate kinase 2-like n=1 Tax=Iris pallida TaxID=29817 RepID=A0AAX6FVG4_IRIPA|nr:pantothenate kinase 2-like [Iris pallida]
MSSPPSSPSPLPFRFASQGPLRGTLSYTDEDMVSNDSLVTRGYSGCKFSVCFE